ncbi:MAG: hypothetical protein IT236_01270 [Bacteroidia bacterium]|nr:hypothetical protein [Bacteroidia bacterium]
MSKRVQLILILLSASSLIFNACKKKETITVDNETQSVVDNALADQEFMAVIPTTQQLTINTKGTGAQGRGVSAICDTLTKISGDTLFGAQNHVDPTYTMNISNSSCLQVFPDGKLRTGALTIRLTNKLKTVGAKMIIKFNQYKTTNIQYTCDSMVVTTVASNSLFTTSNVKLINGVCQTSNWLVKYNLDRTITNYFSGNPKGTEPYTSIYGTANGVNRAGTAFLVNIPAGSPLIKHRNCQYIDKGIMELTPDGFAARSVDYGNGNCDEDATFTVNGNTIAFKLK